MTAIDKPCVIRIEGQRLHFSQEQIAQARQMVEAIRTIEAKRYLYVSRMLAELKDSNGYLLCLEDGLASAGGSEFVVEHSTEDAWGKFVDTLGMSRGHAYKMVGIYKKLIAPHWEQFETWLEEGRLPPIRRLEFLAGRDRSEHEGIAGLLEQARDLDRREWETTVNVEFERMDETEADEAAGKELTRRREAATKREAEEKKPLKIQRFRYESERLRNFIRRQPCLLTGKTGSGEVHAHHIVPRSQGGDDWLNLIPLHWSAHQELHTEGVEALLEKWPGWTRADLVAAAEELLLAYVVELEEENHG